MIFRLTRKIENHRKERKSPKAWKTRKRVELRSGTLAHQDKSWCYSHAAKLMYVTKNYKGEASLLCDSAIFAGTKYSCSAEFAT